MAPRDSGARGNAPAAGASWASAAFSFAMFVDARWTRQRTLSAIAVLLLHVGAGYVLLSGLGAEVVRRASEHLIVFDVIEPPLPPEMVQAAQDRSPDQEGESAPLNLEAVPVPLVAPPPRIEIERPPPIIAAPVPSVGPSSAAGAAPLPGPGTGAGGIGSGLGSGGSGRGTGGGGTKARFVSGQIVNADYPRGASRSGAQGTVTVRLVIDTSGRVASCRVASSSGSEELDSTTCRLIQQRFRYQPALDANGQPTTDEVGWRQTWWFEPR